jgi:hypothetical protein
LLLGVSTTSPLWNPTINCCGKLPYMAPAGIEATLLNSSVFQVQGLPFAWLPLILTLLSRWARWG